MCDENRGLCDGTDLSAYFSNYWDNNTETEEKPEETQKEANLGETDEVVNDNIIMNHIIINVEEELAKYPELDRDDIDDEDDDEFEKL
jgi:hypothetical protein